MGNSKNGEKNCHTIFGFSHNCTWTGSGKVSLLLTEYL